MNRSLTGIIRFINKVNPSILILLILGIFYAGFQPFFNEEIYFGMAKAWADPSWIPGSTLFYDFAGTRILFQAVFGFLLRYISFEQLAFFGRLLGFFLLSLPLAALTRQLKLNNIILVFWLTLFFIPQKSLFYLTPQSFFAGEWIFGGFETKTIAYVFVFWSIWNLSRDRYLQAVSLGAISVWWHMLVGGWYMLYLFIFIFIGSRDWKRLFYYIICAGLIILPFAVHIFSGLVKDNENIINGVNTGYIYAYVRNPHHIGILKNWDYFFHYHAGKVLLATAALILSLTVYKKKLPVQYRWLNIFTIIILCQNLLFLVIALFDKNGFIARFYPWRGSSLAMLFFQLSTIMMLRYVWIPHLFRFLQNRYQIRGQRKFYLWQMSAALMITLAALGYRVADRIEKAENNKPRIAEVNLLASNLKSLSSPGDVFMLLADESLQNISLPRKSERDAYYLFRFVPSQSRIIYYWYCRGQEQEKVKKDITYLENSALKGKINFIVSNSDLSAGFLEEIYRSENYRIYRILN